MIKLFPLIFLALIANLLTVILYLIYSDSTGGDGRIMFFAVIVMPVLWGLSIITALIISIINRKYLFLKKIVVWTILALVFCTPFPLAILNNLIHPTPETQISSTGYNPQNGKIFKTEDWQYSENSKKYVKKYFIADSTAEATYGEAAFKKDSTWTYLNKTGDIIKVEYYKDGKLIKVDKNKHN
jgi:hypothetical protein